MISRNIDTSRESNYPISLPARGEMGARSGELGRDC